MTPAARVQGAIDVLDRVLQGAPLEQALTNWGRANRFAGSGDRSAIRDLVYDAWRCRRSFAALGGAESGRGLMLGRLRALGVAPEQLFTGGTYAPAPLSGADAGRAPSEMERLDCPDWLAPRLQQDLGDSFEPVMLALQSRAPSFLRVNLSRLSRDEAIARLAQEGLEARAHPLALSALELLSPSRKLVTTEIFLSGLIELQDAASQAVVERIGVTAKQSVLDYCAGGGGKSLALAALGAGQVWAHDAEPRRMRDLPARAARAGAKIGLLDDPKRRAPYDLVLADAPCSGSGSWRRDPQGKWALTEERLQALIAVQAEILDKVAPLVAPQGRLAYVTCSLLHGENQHQIAAFLARNGAWQQQYSQQFTPLDGGDGFFLSILTRKS